jgi:hypothetical protein
MTERDDHLIQRIRTSAGVLPNTPPDPSRVIAAGRRRRRKDRLLASGAAVVVALGVVLPIQALLPVGEDKSGAMNPVDLPESCFGYKVDIYAIEDDTDYEGTPGDDVVIQGGTSSYRSNGGMDLTCMVDGSLGGVSADDHPELMDIDNPAKVNEAIRRLIDAEPITGEDGNPPPTEVGLACDGDRADVAAYTVQPQRDGVHFRVDYRDGARAVVLWHRQDDAPMSYSAFELDPSASSRTETFELEPGRYFIGCIRTEADSDKVKLATEGASKPLDVIDFAELWTPAILRCPQEPVRLLPVGPEPTPYDFFFAIV